MLPVIEDRHHNEMDSQGFTVLEDVFSAREMEELGALIDAYQKRHTERLAAVGGTDGGISRADEITFTDHLAEADPGIMEFVKRPEFVALLAQFLGPDCDLYWNQSVYKAGGGTKQFPWHQDDGYTPVTPSPYLTLWLAINDVTVENGSIWVLPGSHKKGLLPHEDTSIGKSCYSLDEPEQGVPVPLKAGSMAVFWSLTVHKSGLNVTDGVRKAFVIQYAVAGLKNAYSQEPVAGMTPVSRDGSAV